MAQRTQAEAIALWRDLRANYQALRDETGMGDVALLELLLEGTSTASGGGGPTATDIGVSVNAAMKASNQPISAAALPLPTGSATETTLAAVLTQLQNDRSISSQLFKDATGTVYLRTLVFNSTTNAYENATLTLNGVTYSPTLPEESLAASDVDTTETSWYITTAGTGYSVGDTISQFSLIKAGNPPTVVAVLWYNQTTAATLVSAPLAGHRRRTDGVAATEATLASILNQGVTDQTLGNQKFEIQVAQDNNGLYLIRYDKSTNTTTNLTMAGAPYAPVNPTIAASNRQIIYDYYVAIANNPGNWVIGEVLSGVSVYDLSSGSAVAISSLLYNEVGITVSGAVLNGNVILLERYTLDQQGAIKVATQSIDLKTPALGQALAANSTPVVLPATQIAALTPIVNSVNAGAVDATTLRIVTATDSPEAVALLDSIVGVATNTPTTATLSLPNIVRSLWNDLRTLLGPLSEASAAATPTTAGSIKAVLRGIFATLQPTLIKSTFWGNGTTLGGTNGAAVVAVANANYQLNTALAASVPGRVHSITFANTGAIPIFIWFIGQTTPGGVVAGGNQPLMAPIRMAPNSSDQLGTQLNTSGKVLNPGANTLCIGLSTTGTVFTAASIAQQSQVTVEVEYR